MLPKRYFTLSKKKSTYQAVQENKYKEFFNNFAAKNYKWINTKCICKANNDELLSTVDRHEVEYHLVICKSCGLIRGKKYLDKESLYDFYSKQSLKIWEGINYQDPESIKKIHEDQVNESDFKWDFIHKFVDKDFSSKNTTIVDVGGGPGGVLDKYKNSSRCISVDINETFFKILQSKGIETMNGGLSEVFKAKIKPDLIILSHVVEHWGDFNEEIKDLIKVCDKDTYIYVEFPGVDSLKIGRRGFDFLEDIFIPHMYYFTSYVFDNIMGSFGFTCLGSTSFYQGMFKLSDKKISINNNYENVKKDIIKAEFKRKLKFNLIKSFLRKIFPKQLVQYIKKIELKIFN